MENTGKKFGQYLGEFINAHPWLSYWSFTALVSGVVTLIRGYKPQVTISLPETAKAISNSTDELEEETVITAAEDDEENDVD